MKMQRAKTLLARTLSVYLAVGLSFPAFAGAPVESSPELAIARNVDTRALVNANPEYVKTVSEMLKAIGAKKVTCTSGYRSPEQQRAACQHICGKDSCPNLCAPPGRSQHQKLNVAVCDLSGLSRDSGCTILKKLCDEKFDGKCGVGGYPGGGYHFGVNDYRFSAWNRCAGLPRPKGNYPASWQPSVDPSPGSGTGSELEASEESNSHELIIIAAVAAAGVGGVLLYNKMRKK
jgi:hypothetical protein